MPSFFDTKKNGDAYGESERRMNPLARFSSMNLRSSSCSMSVSGYILPHRLFCGLFAGSILISWSYDRDGGNLSDAFFSKTSLKSWAYVGTSSSSGISFFPWFAAMAISVDLFIFRTRVELSHRCFMTLDGS